MSRATYIGFNFLGSGLIDFVDCLIEAKSALTRSMRICFEVMMHRVGDQFSDSFANNGVVQNIIPEQRRISELFINFAPAFGIADREVSVRVL
jgi:hypothetical protein